MYIRCDNPLLFPSRLAEWIFMRRVSVHFPRIAELHSREQTAIAITSEADDFPLSDFLIKFTPLIVLTLRSSTFMIESYFYFRFFLFAAFLQSLRCYVLIAVIKQRNNYVC